VKKRICLCLAALILLSVTACGKKEEPEMVYVDEGPVAVTEQPLRDCVLYFTHDCAAEDMLYYARLSCLLQDSEIGYLHGNVGLVDLGGFLREDETQSYDAVDAMNKLGYEAAAVAQNDLQGSLSLVLNASNTSDFPFLCCDLMQGEDPVFDSWTLATHGGRRIAYVGYCAGPDGGSFPVSDGERDYSCTADVETIQRSVDAAKNAGADLVILLVSGADAAFLAIELTGVDLIVSGGESASQTTAGTVLCVPDGQLGRLVVHADGTVECSCETLTSENDPNMLDYLASLGYESAGEDEQEE